jgi:hypothetical protein
VSLLSDKDLTDVRERLKQITDGSVEERAAAWLAFLRLDEDAVQALADELYSGVDEQTGVVILELLAEIGGWEAMIVLQDIYQAGGRDALVKTAARGLARNGWVM